MRRRFVLPHYGVPAHPYPATGETSSLIYGHHRSGIDGAVWTPRGNPESVSGTLGPAQRCTGDQGLVAPISGFVPSNNLTLYFVGRRTTTEPMLDTLMSLSTPSGNGNTLLYLDVDPGGGSQVSMSLGIIRSSSFRLRQLTYSNWINTSTPIIVVARVFGANTAQMDLQYQDAGTIVSSTAFTVNNSVTAATQTFVSVGGRFANGAWDQFFFGNWEITAACVLPYSVSNAERNLMLRDPLYWLRYVQPRTLDIPFTAAAPLPAVVLTAAGLQYRAQPADGDLGLLLNPDGSLTAATSRTGAQRRVSLDAGKLVAYTA